MVLLSIYKTANTCYKELAWWEEEEGKEKNALGENELESNAQTAESESGHENGVN